MGLRPAGVSLPISVRRLNPTVRNRSMTWSRVIPVPSSSIVMVDSPLSIVIETVVASASHALATTSDSTAGMLL